MVIWSGFLAPKQSFSKGAPHQHSENGLGYLDNMTTFFYTFDENFAATSKFRYLRKIKITPILHQIWKYRYKVANNYSIYAVKAFLQICDYVTDGSTQMPKSQMPLRPTGLLTKNRAA